MGRNKKHPASRTKPSSSTPPSSTVNQTSDDFTAANRAISFLHHENHSKAFKIIKSSLSKNNNSPILHRANSEIHLSYAKLVTDSNTKLKHINNSLESAHKATTLSPNSLSLSHYYIFVLFELCKEKKEYDQVIQECDRILSVQNPIDPLKDSLREECELRKGSNPIAKLRVYDLRRDVRKCKNVLSVVKILDDDREEERVKFRANVGDRSEGDGEFKEMIRKKEKKIIELEKKIGEVKILRRKLDLDMEFDPCMTTDNRSSERAKLKGLKKTEEMRILRRRLDLDIDFDEGLKISIENLRKRERVRKYWNERMSDESKKRLLQVRIDELEKCFDKNDAAREVLNEAIGYAKEKGTWKFWECCSCGEKFVDCEGGMKHYKEEHVGVVLKKLQYIVSALEGGVEEEWIGKIENGDWRPVDIKKTVVSIISNRGKGKIEEWSRCIDSERETILENIRHKFRLISINKCLTVSLVRRMIDYVRHELRGLITSSQFKNYGMDKELESICFLGVSELNNADEFLEEVFNLCELIRLIADNICDGQVIDIIERIAFSSDFKCLLLDDRLLPSELIRDMYQNLVVDDNSAVTSVVDVTESEMTPISDDIIDWLFMYFPIEEQLATWTQLRGDKLGGTEAFEVLEAEVLNLKTLCERRSDVFACNAALLEVESICHEEDKKMKQFPESEPQGYASLLRERQKELVERDDDAVFRSTQSRLDTIRDIQEEALSLSFKFEECSKDGDWTNQDCLDLANHYIKMAVVRQRKRLADEVAKVDPMIMARVAALNNFKLKLRRICAYDYRSIMLPLLKSFIQAYLEDLVDKDASEKSDAAGEAFSAKKNISKGSDHGKHMQQKTNNQKSNDKEKNKDHRKPKEFKATGGNEPLQLDQEDTEQVDDPVASVSAYELEEEEEELGNKIEVEEVAEKVGAPVISVSADELEVREEELWNKIVLEEVARKQPTETEAKEKCHSEQDIFMFGSIAFEASSSDFEKSQQGPLVDEIGIPKETSCVLVNTTKGTMGNSSSVSGTQRRNKRSHSYDEFEQETFKEQEDFPLKEEKKMLEKISLEREDFGPLPTDAKVNDKDESIVVGTGLKNDPGEYNCFLNVIIQSLWNLRLFRDEFMAAPDSMHDHNIGDPCVVCALNTIFAYLSLSATENEKKAVDPISLRMALHPSFQEEQMNDASEALAFIFNVLHQSFTSSSGASVAESEGNCSGSWDCVNSTCLVHRLFGMNILQKMKCDERDFESRKQKHTIFFHNINACELREMKSLYGDSSFVELLKLLMNHQLTCDSEEGGCGKLHHMLHILSTPPHFFTAVLGWQTSHEKVDDISATLRILTNEIDLGLLYPNLVSGNRHCLVSVVCYCRLHYICFVYSHENKTWIMYNDEDVKVIGCWGDVLTTCEKQRYQPQVLFFEAVQ